LLSPEEERKAASALPSNKNCFKASERLKKTKDFEKVFRQGRKVIGRYTALHYMHIGEDKRRLGVTVSKRVDKRAVTRNRLKRIFREIFRTEKGAFPLGYDFVLRALPKSIEAQYSELRDEILSLADKINAD